MSCKCEKKRKKKEERTAAASKNTTHSCVAPTKFIGTTHVEIFIAGRFIAKKFKSKIQIIWSPNFRFFFCVIYDLIKTSTCRELKCEFDLLNPVLFLRFIFSFI